MVQCKNGKYFEYPIFFLADENNNIYVDDLFWFAVTVLYCHQSSRDSPQNGTNKTSHDDGYFTDKWKKCWYFSEKNVGMLANLLEYRYFSTELPTFFRIYNGDKFKNV